MTAQAASPIDRATLAATLSSPRLTKTERREVLRLTFSDKRRAVPLVREMGGPDAVAPAYFSDWPFPPNPGPQTTLIFSDADEVLFGGARGGGKSFGFMLHFLDHALHWGRLARGVIFRRRFVDLEDLIRDSWEIFGPLGGKFFAGGGRPSWKLPNGAELRFRYLQRESDAIFYQGQAFTKIYVEEAGTYGTPYAIDLLRGCLRSPHGVHCQLMLNANPGGRGHNWLKARFIDPAEPNTIMEEDVEIRPGEYMPWRRTFIPSKLSDNPFLDTPQYIASLKLSGADWLVRAWLDGDWNIVAGGMFDDILDIEGLPRIVIEPFEVPEEWRIYRALDWGSAKPFSVGWWAQCDGSVLYGETGDDVVVALPARSLVRVAEWYGWNGSPNEGRRMLAADVARGIKEREEKMFPGRLIHPGPADSSIYVSDGVSRSIADELKDPDGDGSNRGVRFVPSDKGPGSRVSGWEAMRRALTHALEVPPEMPGIWVFNTCRQWIRTVPTLPRDEINPEDADSDSEDHVADETRYMLTTKRPTASSEEWRF